MALKKQQKYYYIPHKNISNASPPFHSALSAKETITIVWEENLKDI